MSLRRFFYYLRGKLQHTYNEIDSYPKIYRKACGSSQSLKCLLNNLEIEDMWRTFNTNKEEFTYKSTNNITHARLDRLYISKSARQYTKTKHVPATFSDHYNAIIAEIKLNKVKLDKEMWIINNKHLKNINYQIQLKNLFLRQTNLKHTFEKLTDWWETLKTAIKSHAKTFSKLEAKNKRKKEYKLRKKY